MDLHSIFGRIGQHPNGKERLSVPKHEPARTSRLSFTGFRFELLGVEEGRAQQAGFHWDYNKQVA